ncbi:unnamed protein product [Phytophthora lilii]|uniref:Unnamed protein product n=1 Tax=Phytophthora lilii TaxID=2077276 RepID=A0A9W6TZL3_9STRA|nr:unnamed protein product [Phytophthora lilii]
MHHSWASESRAVKRKSDAGGFDLCSSDIFVNAVNFGNALTTLPVFRLAWLWWISRSAWMVGQDRLVPAEHHDNKLPSGRLNALALSLLDSLLHRRTPQSPRSKNKVAPRSRNSKAQQNSNPRSKREERSRREVARSRREGNSSREGYSSSPPPNVSVRRSSSAKQLRAGWSTRKLRSTSVSNRSFKTKVAATDTDKSEAPEVVTNYVYDVPEKEAKVKIPGADYDDQDDQENDDFDHDIEDEEQEEEDELDFELRPFISEDEDEMAPVRRLHVCCRHHAKVSFLSCHFTNTDSLRITCAVISFNTAVEDDGKLHFSFPSILRQYTRGWFVPEVLWTLPFYAIFEGHDPEAYIIGGSAKAPLFRFAVQNAWLYPTARCLRLMRVVGLPRLQRRLEHSLLISSKVSSLGSFLFVVLALSHVFSCVFAYLAFDDDDQLDFALSSRVLQDSEVKTRYIAAFYWSMMTMTTVGYGDITVKTNAGRLFSIAAMVVGAGVFAYGITNVVSLFQQLYENDTAYRRDMDQINDFMQARMLPQALRDKVRANTFHWRKASRGENKERDRAIVARMASLIRAKVADRFCEDMMPHKMPFLAGCSSEFIHDLYLRMRVQCYLPGEDIISQGDYGSEMYFLFAGHAQVLLGLTKVALFGPNSCFGEFSIANPRKPRLATIQALDFCETHCIDREQILRVLLCHPITVRSARQLATLRSRKALTLVYESGGKSRTLLQGLAMMWRAEGVEAILPAGVSADSLPFLQEFTTTNTVVGPGMTRRGSVTGSIVIPAGFLPQPHFQLHQLHPQQQLDQAQVAQLQQFNASLASRPATPTSSSVITTALTGTSRVPSISIDTAHSLSAAQAPSSTPSNLRLRSGVHKIPKLNPGSSGETEILSADKDSATARKVVSPITRRGSTTSITIGSPLVVLPPTAAQPPRDDRLDQLLNEIRNMASRQHVLEQQLKAMMTSTTPKPKPENLGRRLDSGIIAYEKGRFDEQHWINDHTPPLLRQRSERHITHQEGDGI